MSDDLIHAALNDTEETLRLVERLPADDPLHQAEVERLGDRIGYGALMSAAQAGWRKMLAHQGVAGAEFVAGPCYDTVIHTLAKVRAALETLTTSVTPAVATSKDSMPEAGLRTPEQLMRIAKQRYILKPLHGGELPDLDGIVCDIIRETQEEAFQAGQRAAVAPTLTEGPRHSRLIQVIENSKGRYFRSGCDSPDQWVASPLDADDRGYCHYERDANFGRADLGEIVEFEVQAVPTGRRQADLYRDGVQIAGDEDADEEHV